MTNNSHHIYIVQEFIGCGYTREHIARMRKVTECKTIRAFTEEHEAVKYMESLQKENESGTYCYEKVQLDSLHETL
jgi:hypothetical protein